MSYRNVWLDVYRTSVVPKHARASQVTVTMLRDPALSERIWAFRPASHTVLVHLDDPLELSETQIDGGPLVTGPTYPGAIWLVPAGSRYYCRLLGRAPQICEIAVQGASVGGRPYHMSPVVNMPDGLLHQASLRFAELTGAQSEVSRSLLDCLSTAVQWHIVETYGSSKALPKPNRDPPLSDRAKTLLELHIRDHLADRITLDELAGIVGLSTHNLLKQFRGSFGTTPAQYIINERVAKARLLLQRPSLQITDVALATGFYSPSHFSTVFLKHIGITPTVYRRRALPPPDR